MRIWILLVELVALLLFAVPAGAASWLKSCAAGAVTTGLQLGSFACNIPTSATDDSGILSVGACENIDIFFYDDTDGDGTLGDAEAIMRNCPSASADAQGCWAIENVTLDGDAATGTEAIYGAAAVWIYLDVTAYATTAEPVAAIVRCNGAH